MMTKNGNSSVVNSSHGNQGWWRTLGWWLPSGSVLSVAAVVVVVVAARCNSCVKIPLRNL